MKNLILSSMMAAGILMAFCVSAEENTSTGTTSASTEKAVKQKFDPAKIISKIDARIQKLEEKKAKLTSAGKTEAVSAIDKLIASLNTLKTAVSAKDKTAVKAAREEVKTARAALKALKKEHHQKTQKES